MSGDMLLGGRKNPSVSKQTRRAQFRDARIRVAREFADARNAEHQNLSTEEKIAKLDVRLGRDQGAVKERRRLQAKLVASLPVEVEKPVEEASVQEEPRPKTKGRGKKKSG